MTTHANTTFSYETLRGFSGSPKRYQHWLGPTFVYTEGMKYLADHAGSGAHWLIDAICSHMTPRTMKRIVVEDPLLANFQTWVLRVEKDGSAILTCHSDDGSKTVIEQRFTRVDFPLESIELFCVYEGPQWVIMLPREY